MRSEWHSVAPWCVAHKLSHLQNIPNTIGFRRNGRTLAPFPWNPGILGYGYIRLLGLSRYTAQGLRGYGLGPEPVVGRGPEPIAT